MNERDQVLRDMLDTALAVQTFLVGKSRHDLDIEVVGEAASRVSSETRTRYPQIDGRNIIGMRNRIIHGYSEIDHDIVWNVAASDLPILIAELKAVLPDADEET